MRVRRIELRSFAWKADILAIILHPRMKTLLIIASRVLKYKHMHISSFVNPPDDISLHTNQYAAGTVSSQSFTERQAIERRRQIIQSYQQSRLGTTYADRKEKARLAIARSRSDKAENTTRRDANTSSTAPTAHRFKEPPSRGYNPYA